MKKTLLLFAALAAVQLVCAQALRSRGPVPADLKMSVQQLYDTDVQRAEQYAGRRVRDRQQLLEASYRINKMLAGGHIVYGDSISLLAARIADTLLKDYPQLRSELRFYTVTSPVVNAFTTPQGMIFINAGLVAQLENEAQLAFIIAHEIIHYYRAPGMETLVGDKKKKADKKKKGDKDPDLDDEAEQAGDFMRLHARSREMENEADSLGIALFYLGSPYWKEVTESVFDILQYSELPFDDIPFDTTHFNTPYYKLTGCWLDTVADITARDNYDDRQSTHPNILSRRHRTAQALAGHSGGEKYLMSSPDEFNRLRHAARMECIRQDLLHGHFARACYNSWLLLRLAPDDPILNRYHAHALYCTAVAKCNDREDILADDYHKIEGESQQVSYALHTMSAEQATLAALHCAWQAHLRFPSDGHYTAMSHHLMELLRTTLNKATPDFLSTPPVADDNAATADTTAYKNLTKYERIKQKRQSQTRRNPTAYALTDLLMADTALATHLRHHLDGTATPAPAKSDSARQAMLLFNPNYWVVDKHDNLITTKSNTREDDIAKRIVQTVHHLGGNTVDFSDQGMHTMVSDTQYNDFLTVCEWMNEFWLTKGRFSLCRITQSVMDSLLDRYGARTLTMTAVLNNEGQRGAISPFYALLVPFAPLVLSTSLTGLEHTTMVSLVADAREGRMLTRQAYSYNVADHPSLVDAMLYDTYRRALKPSKREPVGFMGHRFAFAAGANLSLSGYQPLKLNHIFAVTPWASAEFALSRSLSLAFSARYHKSYTDVTQTYHVSRYSEYGYYTGFDSIAVSSRNLFTLGLELRHYKNSDFAPLGYYFDYGVHMTRFSLPDGKHMNNTYGIHLGIGRNYIFYKHLLLNYQIDYGFTYGLLKVVGFESDVRPYLYYADAILSNILTIKVGIGLVP